MGDTIGTSTSHEWSARAQLRACAAAFTFLTRVPAGRLVAHDITDLARAAVYFPVVGLAAGIAAALVFAAALIFWPPYLAVIVPIAFIVWMTGAFHEDALADAFDGFGGGWDSAQVLEIMKDSRVGSYALVGLLVVTAAKMAALYAIYDAAAAKGAIAHGGTVAVARALVAAHVLGRWSSVVLIARHPYVGVSAPGERPSAGKPFAGAVTRVRLLLASAIAFLIAGVALGWSAIGVGAVGIIVIWLAGRYFDRRIGGVTGDALGAANQLVELAAYLALAAQP